MTTLQGKLNWLYDAYLDKKMSKAEYALSIDSFAKTRPEEVSREFGYRKDNRSLGEFAVHMIDQMEIEKEVIRDWTYNFGVDYFGSEVQFEYSGISQNARLICESSSTKDEIRKPDLLVKLGDKRYYVEIKQCPVLYKATYKTSDLKHYHSLGNTYMVTAHTKGKFDPERVEFYTLLTPDALAKLLEDGRQGILKSEKRREMGYKKAVQFTREGLKDYFLIQE